MVNTAEEVTIQINLTLLAEIFSISFKKYHRQQLFSTYFRDNGHPAAELTEVNQHYERANVKLQGTKVAVVTGIVLNSVLRDCFGNNGLEMAKGWAGALYDQWFFSGIPGTLNSIEALVSTKDLTTQYCFTVDAVFTFAGASDAQRFATFVGTVVGNTKRDGLTSNVMSGNAVDVFLEGVDLPFGHAYFGSNTTGPEKGSLSGRSFGSCSNKCGFSYTNDQTSICRDQAFPLENIAFC
ncbi:Mitochondrial import inner membrane translocase subunit TIM8 [Purpureocillium lavendulum]|uniref:Mitochondrial import inner membrane translocase subunit TIM8 n=1 Tax=Purpureocillium lavendulum TaxID=1247861 RepID=A0AB34FTM6_9HYPO|nr:Mitochondrial import inner membrane translocase subunit TIM8 [Purpureocillium lavendulum]